MKKNRTTYTIKEFAGLLEFLMTLNKIRPNKGRIEGIEYVRDLIRFLGSNHEQ